MLFSFHSPVLRNAGWGRCHVEQRVSCDNKWRSSRLKLDLMELCTLPPCPMVQFLLNDFFILFFISDGLPPHRIPFSRHGYRHSLRLCYSEVPVGPQSDLAIDNKKTHHPLIYRYFPEYFVYMLLFKYPVSLSGIHHFPHLSSTL